MGPCMLRSRIHRLGCGQADGPEQRGDGPGGQSRVELSHYHEAGKSGRTVNVERMLVRERRKKRCLLRSTSKRGHDGTLANLRGGDGIFQTSIRTLSVERRRFRREKRVFQDRGNLSEVLSGGNPFSNFDLGGSRSQKGDQRSQ